MLATYNLPVLGHPTAHMQRLIRVGALRPAPEPPSGCRGPAYTLRTPDDWQVIDDFGAELAGSLLQVNLFRLPTAAYRALLSASPRVRQHDVVALAQALRAGDLDRRAWWTHLFEAVRAGPRPTRGSAHAQSPLLQHAVWLPDRTMFSSTQGGGWTVTLAFEMHTQLSDHAPRDTALGIDVGIQPLAACAGHEHLALYATTLLRPSDRRLETAFRDERSRHLARRLHHLLIYGEARRQWETLMADQLPRASVVCVEQLTLPDMQARFRWASTELGIADFLLSWLPQTCYEVGVPVVRVDPAYTSLRCARCYRWGDRPGHGDVFVCPVHGPVNAHTNAAQVIQRLGLAALLQEARETAPWAQAARRERP